MKKVHRFLLPADLSHQIRDVLKMEGGEIIDLMDGQGLEARAKIVTADDAVEVEVTSVTHNQNDPSVKVVLYCAILKRENFELVVQKATEVGATEIVPLITDRTVKTGLKMDRLQKIIAEATEQSGRGVVPMIHESMSLKAALIDAARNDRNVFLHPSVSLTSPPLSEGRLGGVGGGRVGLFVGPEGGWTEQEVAQAIEAECTSISLGRLVMRGETAAIVATYLASTGKL